MGLFENYHREAAAIELEIERKGIVLGIDWADTVQVRQWARDALLDGGKSARYAAANPQDTDLQARAELFALAALMMKTMQQSAEDGIETHGGPIWKTLGRALWQESLILDPDSPQSGPG